MIINTFASKYSNRKEFYLGFNEFNKTYINNLKFIISFFYEMLILDFVYDIIYI